MSCININEVSKVLDMNEAIFHPQGCMCETCKAMRQNINHQGQTQAQGQGQLKFDPWSVQLPHQPNPKPPTTAEWLQLQERHDYWKSQAEKADYWKQSLEYWENNSRKLADNAAHWEKMASMHLFRKAKLEEFYELYIKHIDAVKVLDEADDLKCKTAEAVIAYGKELAKLDEAEY